MAVAHTTDLNLSQKDISGLTSADAVAGFLSGLGYNTSTRKTLTAEAIGLAGESAAPIKSIELLSEDSEGFLRVVFVQLRSLTARSRLDLARVLGRANVDHLLILSSDFSTIEFVLLDKRRRDHRGPGGIQRIQVVPLVFAVARKAAGSRELRTVRRLTWTRRDGLEQFDKLRSVIEDAQINILVSTDVLSEGQNLQDCGALINYDLTWNPIRLVQRNGRIDRIGSPHSEIGIYNMFPEEELEALLHLIERLTTRISAIDAFGLLDASILGEVVHPRTFNTLRRIRDEDGAVLDEEEARAELAGPELLLKHLKEVLNKETAESIADLPHGIHSGLRRQKAYGVFFYFQAPRTAGEGKRHFWRYIDARSHQIIDNRYEIAQRIACSPDEPRYIGDQDVFALQDRVIEHIMAADREAEARAAAPAAVDPVQQTVAEELKDALRRQTVDREIAKGSIRFLGQPMGRSLHQKLERVHKGSSAVCVVSVN